MELPCNELLYKKLSGSNEIWDTTLRQIQTKTFFIPTFPFTYFFPRTGIMDSSQIDS